LYKLSVVRPALNKLNPPFNFRKEGVVFTTTHVVACVHFSSTLTNNDTSRAYELTAKPFNAKAFAFGIATVTSTTTCFFVRHFATP